MVYHIARVWRFIIIVIFCFISFFVINGDNLVVYHVQDEDLLLSDGHALLVIELLISRVPSMVETILCHLDPVVFNIMLLQLNFFFVVSLRQLSRSLILFELDELLCSILFIRLTKGHDSKSTDDHFEVIASSGSSSLGLILMLIIIYNCHSQLLL